MNLNHFLGSCVREAQNATNDAVRELDRVRRMYQMTPEGVTEQRNRLFTAARETADAAKARGLEAIETACAELDAQEQAEGERRAADLAYMQRLESKLRIAQGMGEMTDKEADRARLKTLFAEFEGDPLAVAVIRQTLGAEKAFFFLPDDNTGKRQQHLRGNVRTLFEKSMRQAGCDPAAYGGNEENRNAECAAFVDYCAAQDAYFTRDDREVWRETYDKRQQEDKPAAPAFDMAVMSLK